MTASKKRRRLVGGVLVPVGLVIIGVGEVFFEVGRQLDALETLYLDAVESSQAREYPREPLPPYWDVQEGSAAEQYMRAWELCDDSGWTHDQRISLNVAIRTLRELPPDAGREDVFDQLEEGLLEIMDACRPAMDALRQGNTRSDATSPLNLWGDWRLHESGVEERVPSRFSQIGKLQVLRAYESGAALLVRRPSDMNLTPHS